MARAPHPVHSHSPNVLVTSGGVGQVTVKWHRRLGGMGGQVKQGGRPYLAHRSRRCVKTLGRMSGQRLASVLFVPNHQRLASVLFMPNHQLLASVLFMPSYQLSLSPVPVTRHLSRFHHCTALSQPLHECSLPNGACRLRSVRTTKPQPWQRTRSARAQSSCRPTRLRAHHTPRVSE